MMHVFVESNFLLELAFRQSEYEVCERIRRGAGALTYALYLPQYALAEVFEKLRPLRNRRDEYRRYLLEEIAQHRREDDSHATKMDDLTQALTTLLEERTQQQTSRLYTVASELAQEASTLPLSPAVIQQAYSVAQLHNLSPQDGLVYASVIDACANCHRKRRKYSSLEIKMILVNLRYELSCKHWAANTWLAFGQRLVGWEYESGSMDEGEILRELVWLILHPVPVAAVG